MQTGPEVIKLFFILNSAEPEIRKVHKYKNIKKFRGFFSGTDKPRMLFFLLINVKMPTTYSIKSYVVKHMLHVLRIWLNFAILCKVIILLFFQAEAFYILAELKSL